MNFLGLTLAPFGILVDVSHCILLVLAKHWPPRWRLVTLPLGTVFRLAAHIKIILTIEAFTKHLTNCTTVIHDQDPSDHMDTLIAARCEVVNQIEQTKGEVKADTASG